MEIAVLGPVLLLAVFAVVQAGLWFHARSLALAAAQEGVAAARGYTASADTGLARARAFLDRAAGDSLHDTTVTRQPAPAHRVRIQVSGMSLSVLPGIGGIPVTQDAEGPVERFTTEALP